MTGLLEGFTPYGEENIARDQLCSWLTSPAILIRAHQRDSIQYRNHISPNKNKREARSLHYLEYPISPVPGAGIEPHGTWLQGILSHKPPIRRFPIIFNPLHVKHFQRPCWNRLGFVGLFSVSTDTKWLHPPLEDARVVLSLISPVYPPQQKEPCQTIGGGETDEFRQKHRTD